MQTDPRFQTRETHSAEARKNAQPGPGGRHSDHAGWQVGSLTIAFRQMCVRAGALSS